MIDWNSIKMCECGNQAVMTATGTLSCSICLFSLCYIHALTADGLQATESQYDDDVYCAACLRGFTEPMAAAA